MFCPRSPPNALADELKVYQATAFGAEPNHGPAAQGLL
jgi:hypothetical protein